MKSKYRAYKPLMICALFFCCYSCTKLVDVGTPENRIVSSGVYASDVISVAVLNGLYTKMLQSSFLGGIIHVPNISFWAGLSADEFTLWSGATTQQIAYYRNALTATAPSSGSEVWQNSYASFIYSCNAAIDGLNASNSLMPATKSQLLGEAKFLRALYYFYLVNFYGDVPLVLSTNYATNSSLARTAKAQVYLQIIQDLKDAQNLMVDGYAKADAMTLYPASSAERVRPNKAAATALLARVYLFNNDYINAEAQANAVINNTAYYSLPALKNVFLKNSMEAIWQLQPVSNGGTTNTNDAVTYLLTYAPAGINSTHPVYLSAGLLNAFENNDQRKLSTNWVSSYTDVSGTYYYSTKYKDATVGTGVTPTEYTMVLRLGEQYLIRAEARAQQGNISGAQSDLNTIRNRAGLANTTAATQATLITAILHEKQVELFGEFGGHRWLDLKRSGMIDAVMNAATILKGTTWNSYQQLYPIPIADLQKDLNLTQNNGY